MATRNAVKANNDEIKEENNVTETSVTDTEENIETPGAEKTEENTDPNQAILDVLSSNPILVEFAKQYLSIFGKISEYNKSVLAAKDSEWNVGKVMTKAQEFAKPEPNSGVKPNEEIAKLFAMYEELVRQVAVAKRSVIDATAKELGISLSNTAERDPAKEEELKTQRGVAVQLGTQLSSIATMVSDKEISNAVTDFLSNNPLPSVGRASTHTFAGNDGKGTPKYRVSVEILKDGNSIGKFDGFSKTAVSLSQSVFGYERGKAPKADMLRQAWESAGNTPENTVKNVVEFDDNNLHYILTKK